MGVLVVEEVVAGVAVLLTTLVMEATTVLNLMNAVLMVVIVEEVVDLQAVELVEENMVLATGKMVFIMLDQEILILKKNCLVHQKIKK